MLAWFHRLLPGDAALGALICIAGRSRRARFTGGGFWLLIWRGDDARDGTLAMLYHAAGNIFASGQSADVLGFAHKARFRCG